MCDSLMLIFSHCNRKNQYPVKVPAPAMGKEGKYDCGHILCFF